MKQEELIESLHKSLQDAISREDHYRNDLWFSTCIINDAIEALLIIEAAHLRLIGNKDDILDLDEDLRQLKMDQVQKTEAFWNWRAWGSPLRKFKDKYPHALERYFSSTKSSRSSHDKLMFEEKIIADVKKCIQNLEGKEDEREEEVNNPTDDFKSL